MAQMEYRFNFIGNLSMETGYLFVKLSYVVVVYRSGVKINGLSPDEILLFIGTFVMLTGVYAGMFMINNFRLRGKIKDGDLDLLLTKPVSLQFMATLRQADVTIFSVDVIAGLDHGRHRLEPPGHPGDALHTWAGMPAFCRHQLPGELQPVPAAADPVLLADEHQRHRRDHRLVLGFQQHADGYLHLHRIQQIGVFILPIFVITNFPPMFVLNKMPPVYLAWSAVLPLILLLRRCGWCGSGA